MQGGEDIDRIITDNKIEIFKTIDLLKGYWIPTLTNVFRNAALQHAVSSIEDDFTLLANISSKGGYMAQLPFTTATYRYHGAGLVSGQSLYIIGRGIFGQYICSLPNTNLQHLLSKP